MNVSDSEWKKIQRDLAKLAALEAGGVDNWEWYGESLAEWSKENELDELVDNFVDNINDLTVDAEVDEPAGRGCGYNIIMPQNDLRELFIKFAEEYSSIKG